jgi:hypothetical protein
LAYRVLGVHDEKDSGFSKLKHDVSRKRRGEMDGLGTAGSKSKENSTIDLCLELE